MVTTQMTHVRLGTRSSALARWQTDYVSTQLRASHPHLEVNVEVISTYGDRVLDSPLPAIGGKGVFTAELEQALLSHTIDIATHSLKDLPTEMPPGLALGAISQRAHPGDVLISKRGYNLQTLPRGATVGTSSQRRKAQLLYQRPDLKIVDTRGNIDTRIRKALDEQGTYDAVVLAYAGLQRLEYQDVITQVLPFEHMLPAPGQGALGIQCRDEPLLRLLLTPIHHQATALAVIAERAFLSGLGGGCAMPIAAYANVEQGYLSLQGRVCAIDGSKQIDAQSKCVLVENMDLAQKALQQGAAHILEQVR